MKKMNELFDNTELTLPFNDEDTIITNEEAEEDVNGYDEQLDPEFKEDVGSINLSVLETTESSAKESEDVITQIMKRFAKIESRKYAIQKAAEAEIEGIRSQCELMVNEEDRKRQYVEFMSKPLLEAFLSHYIENRDKKNYKTLYGTISYRKQRTMLRINDKEAAIEWAKTNYEDAIKTTVSTTISQRDLQKYLEDTGELADGCAIVGGEDKFEIKPALKVD